jgi:hypothetical protein
MACDSAWSDNSTLITRRNKIVRLKSGGLIGSAGDDDSRAVEALFDRVKTPAGLPTRKELLELVIDYVGIVVLPKGRIYHVAINEPSDHQTHWTGGLFEIGESFHAVGSGSVHAITAMECGKTARDAVHAAINRDMHCRAPVYTFVLAALDKPPAHKARRKK